MPVQLSVQELVPQRGRMCLLDAVETWDSRRIVCRAISHRDAGNPLRRAGRLPAICGIEYGLQAMAAHGALVAATARMPGYLASLRGVRINVAWLDDVAGPLTIEARRQTYAPHGLIYEFLISAAAGILLIGRAMVVVPANAAGNRR